MIKEDIDKYLDQRPFEPLRVTTSLGETFKIARRDMVISTRDVLAIGLQKPGRTDSGIADSIVPLSVEHVAKIEPMKHQSKPRSRKKE